MACYVRIDASPEEEKRNLTASNNAIETLEMRKDILWSLYEEHREHARHTETLRSTVISMLIVASAGLVTLATYDKKLNTWDLPAAALLVSFGLLGLFFSLYHTEKIAKHKMWASEYWNELDETVVVRLNGGQLKVIRERAASKFPALSEGQATNKAATKFAIFVIKRSENIGIRSSLILWGIFPLLISAIGVFIAVLFLLAMFLERVMNLAEKPHQNADSSVNSVPGQSPVFRISKRLLTFYELG
jgi:hypothetical protein